MLVAMSADGQLVNLLEGKMLERQPYYCPACGSAVRLKQGRVMRPHFAHVSLKHCHFFYENESSEHLALKAMLYQALKRAGHSVEVEAVLSDIGQVADLLVNNQLVLEVQCSRLSLERLKARTQAYQQAGYSVLWLLGQKLWVGQTLSPLQKGMLYFSQNMGFHLWELDWMRECIRLQYLLHETLTGQVVGLTKTSHLETDLLQILRQPFVRQPLALLDVLQEIDPLTYVQRQLYQKNKKWLSRQALAYAQGGNLLAQSAEAFYPQVRPIEGELYQVMADLTSYYRDFLAFYQSQDEKTYQRLYSPRFYSLRQHDLDD